jgi:putative hemolysin
MFLNLVDLERKRLKDVMLPWQQVVSIDVHLDWQQVEEVVVRTRHTRVPVTQEGKIVGVLHTKEFMALRPLQHTDWSRLVRTGLQLPESLTLLRGLKLLQDQRMHLAIVSRDETPLGIVTLEDIIEEVVGELYDEDDDDRLTALAATLKSRAFSTAVPKKFPRV